MKTNLFERKVVAPMPRSENFPLEVVSYDTTGEVHFVNGIRLDTKEEVRVSLGVIPDDKKGEYERPSIAKLAKPRKMANEPGTAPGGVLMAQRAVKKDDGSYEANWLKVLSHDKDEAFVMTGRVHITTPRSSTANPNKNYIRATIISDGDFTRIPQEVKDAIGIVEPILLAPGADDPVTIDMIRDGVADLLGAGIGVGIRFKTPDDKFDSIFAYGDRTKAKEMEKRAAEFVSQIPQSFIDDVNAGEAVLEVIPFTSMFFGPQTVGVYSKNANEIAKTKIFNPEGEKGSQQFCTAAVAFRRAENNGPCFVTSVELMSGPRAVTGLSDAISYAQTETFAPEIPAKDADASFTAEDDTNLVKAAGGEEPGDDDAEQANRRRHVAR